MIPAAIPFPLDSKTAASLKGVGSTFSSLAKLTEPECRRSLRTHWRNLEFPENRTFADVLLSLPKLFLSEVPPFICEARAKSYWLTFANDEICVCLEALEHSWEECTANFAVDAVPALREFLTYFGGATDLTAPSRFLTPAELHVAHPEDDWAWGTLGKWVGALAVYRGGTGDTIIVLPNGTAGQWQHEFASGDPDEQAVTALKRTFRKLVLEYIDYCRMDSDCEAKQKTPFYY